MTPIPSHHLEDIRDNLRLDLSEEKEIINELETHVEDRFQELKEAGLSEEEAIRTCLKLFGPAKEIAQQIYEAHSQGTWQQAFLAATPHLLYGMLFALNWWQYVGWQMVMLLLILSAAIYGLWRGKPAWIFPWLGYTLLPVVIAGILLLHLPKEWSWLAIPFYIPLSLWWLHYIMLQSMKKDWLFTSLMLLPIPILTGWVLAIEPSGRFTDSSFQHIYRFAPSIGLSFLALSLAIAAFIRLRQRQLRIAVLIISGLLTLTMIAYYAEGRLNLPAFLILTLAMAGLFLIPALLDRRIRSSSKSPKTLTQTPIINCRH